MRNGEKITFWSFLTNFSICIPIIQRDYAQGRIGKEELRKRFIGSLTKSILKKTPLALDFAYGQFSEKDKVFYPLDGQQRLTTLWLLHWFVAYKASKLPDAKAILQKFFYATRVSARDFCNKLCELTQMQETDDFLKYIQNQNWFYSSWRQDPTIQSMLRMISDKESGLVKLLELEDYEEAWAYLTSQECKMCFRVLDIAELGQTDDLYIKMNARGKALTSFENFKAELLNYIHEQAEFPNNDQSKWKALDNPSNGFGQKLDNAWTDIFWKLRSVDESNICEYQNHIDEIFFAFFNRFIFNYQALKVPKDWNKSSLYGEGNDETLAFSSLSYYYIPDESSKERIPLDVFTALSTVLCNWPALRKALLPEDSDRPFPFNPSWHKDEDKDSFFFLPTYEKREEQNLSLVMDKNGNSILKVLHITVKQRAVFFAICQWLLHNTPVGNSYSEEQVIHFQDWLRVVWNIVENSETDNNLSGTLSLINDMASRNWSTDILSSLVNNELDFTISKAQIAEEKAKARLIYNEGKRNLEWAGVIREAESYSFLKGSISALFPTDECTEQTPKDISKRLDLLKDLIDDNDDYKLVKVLISRLPSNFTIKDRIYLLRTSSNWKDLICKHLKEAFRNTNTNIIDCSPKPLWIKLLSNTCLLNKSRTDGKTLAMYWGRVVLYGTPGCSWNAVKNVILDEHHYLPSLAQLIEKHEVNPCNGYGAIPKTSVFEEKNIIIKKGDDCFRITDVGQLQKEKNGKWIPVHTDSEITDRTTEAQLKYYLEDSPNQQALQDLTHSD